MPLRCWVPGCKWNQNDAEHDKRSLFLLPSDIVVAKRLLNQLMFEDDFERFAANERFRMCEKHFTIGSYKTYSNGRKKLLKNPKVVTFDNQDSCSVDIETKNIQKKTNESVREKIETTARYICFICGEFMMNFRNNLLQCTGFSEKPIFEIFESFTNRELPQDVISSTGVCQSCFMKFNEYEEHFSLAQRIQNEIISLYDSSSENMDLEWNYKCNIDPMDYSVVEDQLIEIVPDESSELQNNKFLQPKANSAEFESPETFASTHDSENRLFERKRHPDEGLIVMELDDEKIYQCEVCKKLCKNRNILKNHRETHSSTRNYCCTECGAMFKTFGCLSNHNKIHQERIYHQCYHCEMRYVQKTQLRKHMDAIHLKKKDYVCSICGKCYSRDTTLSVHMFTHKEEKDIACEICGFRTHWKKDIKRHMRIHTGEKNYSCKICGKRFRQNCSIKLHVKLVHDRVKPKIDVEKLTCKSCGRRFQRIAKLKEHMQEDHQLVEEVVVSKKGRRKKITV